MAYFVVIKNVIKGNPYHGVLTQIAFESKGEFDVWGADPSTKKLYEVVAHGVTEEESLRLCSTPEADLALAHATVRSRKINEWVKGL